MTKMNKIDPKSDVETHNHFSIDLIFSKILINVDVCTNWLQSE